MRLCTWARLLPTMHRRAKGAGLVPLLCRWVLGLGPGAGTEGGGMEVKVFPLKTPAGRGLTGLPARDEGNKFRSCTRGRLRGRNFFQ